MRIQMKRKDLTKIYLMISNWIKTLVLGLHKHTISALFDAELYVYMFHSFEAGIADAISIFKWMKNIFTFEI